MPKDDIDGVVQIPSRKPQHKEPESPIDVMWAKEVVAAKSGPRRPCTCCRTNPANPGKRYAWQGVQLVLADCPLCNGTKEVGVL